MFALISFVTAAFALDTVVYGGGDPAPVLQKVAAASGTPVEGLRAVSVTELVSGRPPTLVGGGKLTVCSGTPASLASVRQSVDLAKGAIAYMEFGSARAALDAAIRDLGCIQEPVDGALASRAWYLLGIVTADDQAASRASFRQARLMTPDMVWDDNFSPAARGTFDAVATELKSGPLVQLSVIPEPPEGSLRVDGRPVKTVGGRVGVTPGAHHVQFGTASVTTMTMDLDANSPATLVLPSIVTASALDWAGDGDKRGALSSVLLGALGGEDSVYVVSGAAIWRVRLGGSAWDLVGAGGGPVAVSEPAPVVMPVATQDVTGVVTPKQSVTGPVVIGVGAAAALTGGILLGVGYSGAIAAYDDAVANGRTAEGDAAYADAGGTYSTGWVVAGLGAAIATAGLVVTVAF